MLRVADAIISLQPQMITLCGGEPLTIKQIVDVARHFTEAGVNVFLYTSAGHCRRQWSRHSPTWWPRSW